MTALPLPNARTQFVDADGAPIVGGQVFTYVPSTTTPKSTWQDSGQTILNLNPIILDDLGSAAIWAVGAIRQVVYNAVGDLVWDQVTSNALGTLASIDLSNVDPTTGRAALQVADFGFVKHNMSPSGDVQGSYGTYTGTVVTARDANLIASNTAVNVVAELNRDTVSNFFNNIRSDVLMRTPASINTGGVHAVFGNVQFESPTAVTNNNRNYVAIGGYAQATSGDGGTGTSVATAKGALFGMGGAAFAFAGATNWLDIVGAEFDVFTYAGSSYAYARGVSITAALHHPGALFDGALTIGQISGVGWKNLIVATDTNGIDPTDANTTILGTYWAVPGQRTILNGIDLSTFSPTDAYFKGQYAKLTNSRLTLGTAAGLGFVDIVAGTATVDGGTVASRLGSNGAYPLRVVGVATGNVSYTLQGGPAAATPFWSVPVDFTVRSNGSGTLDVNFPTTTVAPSAGAGGALPATPAGYLTIKINGVAQKIPYY